MGISGRQLWDNVRQRALTFASRRFTATYGDAYEIPLPDAPQPPPHPEYSKWPYWTGITSELASHLELTAAMCIVEPSPYWWERLDRLVAGICSWETWTDPDYLEGRFITCLDTAFLTTAAAMVYDWTGAGLPSERRAELRRALIEKGLEPLARQAATPGNYVSELSWVNGSGQAIAALGIGALALLGEEARAAEWARLAEEKARAWIDRHVHRDGALAEQMGYGGWMADLFALYGAAAERLTNADLAGSEKFQEILNYGIALLTPDGAQTVNFGDDGDLDGAPPSLQLYARYWAAVRNDPRAQWYLSVSGAGRVERTVNPRVRADISISALMRLVWHRVDVPVQAPNPKETTRIFPTVGLVTMRTGWEPDDSLVAVRGGPLLPHGHLDFGSFMIYHGGKWLVWDPGYAVFNIPFPPGIVTGDVEQLNQYTASNLGHSTLVVDGQPCPGTKDLPPPVLESNLDGLQDLIGNGFGEHVDWTDLPTGSKVVRVDASGAYPGQLERFVRRFCFVPPASLVIVDDVVPVPHATNVEWRIRTRESGTWREGPSTPGSAVVPIPLRSETSASWVWECGMSRLRVSFWVSDGTGQRPVDARVGSMVRTREFGEHLGLQLPLEQTQQRASVRDGTPRLVALTLLDWD